MLYVTKYIDANVSKLSTAGPSKRTLFSELERQKIYDLIDFDKTLPKTFLKKSNYVKSSWKIVTDPFNLVMMMIIRFSKLHKLEQLNSLAVTYLTLSMYPSLHYKYFKFEPKKRLCNILSITFLINIRLSKWVIFYKHWSKQRN